MRRYFFQQNQRFENVSCGNAVQQVAVELLRGNRYLDGYEKNVTGKYWGKLRPDFHKEIIEGKVAVLDITTIGQGPKIKKYDVKGVTNWLIKITY